MRIMLQNQYKTFFLSFFCFFLILFSLEAKVKKPKAPRFDVLHYNINLTLNEKDLTFQTKTKIRLKALKRIKKVTLHLKDKTITVPLIKPLAKGEVTTIEVEHKGKANERHQEGLFVVRPDPKGLPFFFTQFEFIGARKVFPCYDEPFDKATTEVTITANAKYTLLSNGEKISEKRLPGGKKRVHFVNKDPISTYHITFVAAPLRSIKSVYVSRFGKKKIPLTIYARPEKIKDVAFAMQALKKSFRFLEDYFGIPYPWDQYGIVALPRFIFGGMENKGLANLGEGALLWNKSYKTQKKISVSNIIAHELAHEWFGNLVTMEWWDDLWLNEAFASFMNRKFNDQEYGEDYSAMRNFRSVTRVYFPQDRGAFSHPIVTMDVDTINEMFDSITYTKGRQVVGMLEEYIGREAFQKGVRLYFKKHRFGNATTQDFLSAMEEASGKSLKTFAKSWLYQKGYPRLVFKMEPEKSKKDYVRLTILQKNKPFVFRLNVGNESLLISKRKEVFSLPAPKNSILFPINRGGKTLLEYEWEGLESKPLEDRDPFVRYETMFRILRQNRGDVKTIAKRLKDPSRAVSYGIVLNLVENDLEPDFSKKISRAVWREAKQVFLELSPNHPVESGLRRNLLILLGQADLPHLYPFLKKHLNSSFMSDQLGALEGLLKSSFKDRYALFEKKLEKNRNQHRIKRDLLRVLASIPKKEILAKVNQYLSNPRFVDKNDVTIPSGVWGAISYRNKKIAFSKEGVEQILYFTKKNLDRPKVAARALRILQGAAEAPKDLKKEIRVAMNDLLALNPPDYIRAMGEKILAAARN